MLLAIFRDVADAGGIGSTDGLYAAVCLESAEGQFQYDAGDHRRLVIALNLDILKTALADVDKYAAPNHPHIHGSKAQEVHDGK